MCFLNKYFEWINRKKGENQERNNLSSDSHEIKNTKLDGSFSHYYQCSIIQEK